MEPRLPTLERASVQLRLPTLERTRMELRSPTEVSRVEPVQLLRPAVKRFQSPTKASRVEPGRVTVT